MPAATDLRRRIAASLPPRAREALLVLRRWATDRTALEEDLSVRRDSRAFRTFAPVFRGSTPASGAPAVAVSLSGWPYQLKLEGMLLKALETHGSPGLLVTDLGSRRQARRYMETFRIPTVDLTDVESPAISRAEAEELVGGDLTVQRLKTLRYREANVGQHVLSTLSRTLYRGSVALTDEQSREMVMRLLPRSMALTHTAEGLLDRLQPELLVFNEARYSGYGPIFETALARGLNVIQFVHAFSDDSLVFKRYTAATSRLHPRSVGEEAWREVRAGPWTPAMEEELAQAFERRYAGSDALSRRMYSHTRDRDRAQLVDELSLDASKRTAVVFSHVLWDANLFYGDDLFDDQEAWLLETIKAAVSNPELNWVVKLHPANIWKRKLERKTGELPELASIRREVGTLPPHVRLLLPESEVNARSLFAVADFGVTIRGTVGVEAPCFGIPVVTGGTSHYGGRGFTLDSETPDDYLRLLARLHEQSPLAEEAILLARKHAHALFHRRPLRFTSFRSHIDPEGRRGVLSHELEIAVSSPDELAQAPDLNEFASWARSSREDYLKPLE